MRIFSEEHRRHLSEALRGHSFNKGIPKSKEHREKLRLANLGKKASPETRQRMSEAHTGRHPSAETIKKLRASNVGLRRSEAAKQNMRGEHSWQWNGGIRHHCGYLQITSPNHPFCSKKKYVCAHRLVVEGLLSRYLQPSEQVHHINRKRVDNRPENLMAFVSNSAHRRFEGGGKVKPSEIIFDGRLLKRP
jgi:hypothetical protein